ncbi:hypothetical protein ACFLWK_00915 [Chloroflexota bacterium]
MSSKYEIGQKVLIAPVDNQLLSPRGSDLGEYAGQSGQVIDYYWIGSGSDIFYIYTVKTEADNREIVLHEDEIQIYLG